jgi:lipoyl synthase
VTQATTELASVVASHHVSPEWVRISMASAIALRYRSGRFTRDFAFGGINLLLDYTEGCLSDCAYCGLARTRPGKYDDKSFIRVEWPLVQTDDFVERMLRRRETLTRICISMVTHGRSYRDTLDITRRITSRLDVPLSILVAPPTLDRERLVSLKDAGADMIGIGLDAVTKDLFRELRTDVPQGGLRWDKYWEIVGHARAIFGPWKVNCHTLVGIGETDRDLVAMFEHLRGREIYSYLFSFNPEPDSRLGHAPRAPLTRWRRIQLVKYMLEAEGIDPAVCEFDDAGALVRLRLSRERVLETIWKGEPFMTNGCPGPNGEPGCTRPYGSYRPSEAFRDFPFLPIADDRIGIIEDLRLDELLATEA